MKALVSALARRLLTVEDLAALVKGAEMADLGLTDRSYADREWDYRCTKSRVRVDRSPVGSGRVTWDQLAELINAGLSTSEVLPKRVIVGLAAVDAGRGPTATKLRRAGLDPDATAADIAARRVEVVNAVVDRGVIAVGGAAWQPSLFERGSVA